MEEKEKEKGRKLRRVHNYWMGRMLSMKNNSRLNVLSLWK